MLTFTTPTPLPIEAATTMGVSVKETDHAIGKFGTGLKYAIAGVLRLGGRITIYVDGEEYAFDARDADIRGRSFRIVNCNGVPCGFTTDLGKHWEAWQVFRELASNALDEGGSWTHDAIADDADRTVMVVLCREVEDAEREEQVFLGDDRTILVDSANGATIYEGRSPHYYFRGIRAGSFDGIAPVTVNVHDGALSEDRLLDVSCVNSEMAWAFRSAKKFDERLMLAVLAAEEPSEFWVRNLSTHVLATADLPRELLAFMDQRNKWIKHPAFRLAMECHRRNTNAGDWSEVEITARHRALLDAGEAICAAASVDPIPRERVHFTSDLPDNSLAVTRMDTRHVWFSTKLVMLGRDEFMAGYLEEAMHAMTGFRDCTRELQNALLSLVVSLAGESARLSEAA